MNIDATTHRYSEGPTPEFIGPLAVNEELRNAEKLFENDLIGPEAFVQDSKGFCYCWRLTVMLWRVASVLFVARFLHPSIVIARSTCAY